MRAESREDPYRAWPISPTLAVRHSSREQTHGQTTSCPSVWASSSLRGRRNVREPKITVADDSTRHTHERLIKGG